MISRTNYIVSAIFLIFGLAVVWCYIVPGVRADSSYLQGNIAPELLGFCLEGLLFVGLFGLLNSIRDHKSKSNLRAVLNSIIGEFKSEMNKDAIKAVELMVSSLEMDLHNPHHSDASKKKLEVIGPLVEKLRTDAMQYELRAFYELLDFVEHNGANEFGNMIKMWSTKWSSSLKHSEYESYLLLAASDSPDTLKTWSNIIYLIKGCYGDFKESKSSEFRKLGKVIEKTKI